MVQKLLSASILDADHKKMKDELYLVEQAGVDMFSVDVMDNTLVERKTFDASFTANVCQWTNLPVEVHLMVNEPDQYVAPMVDAGVDLITIHVESKAAIEQTLKDIRGRGVQAGLAVNVTTDIAVLTDFLPFLDVVTLMAIPIGRGGQKLNSNIYTRIAMCKQMIEQSATPVAIQIDGGVKQDCIGKLSKAGADILTVGTGIYHAPDKQEAVAQLQKEITDAGPAANPTAIATVQAGRQSRSR